MSTLSSSNFTVGYILLKERTQTINNEIKLHILGVPMNELGNWLMATFDAGTSCHVNSATVFFVTNVDETDVTNKLWCSV